MIHDEWCKGCSEYDHKKHYCPRRNKVIKQTLEDMERDAISRKSVLRAKFPVVSNEYQVGWNDAINSIVENEPSVKPKHCERPMETAEANDLERQIKKIRGAIEINELVAQGDVAQQVRKAIMSSNQERQQLVEWLEDYRSLRGVSNGQETGD